MSKFEKLLQRIKNLDNGLRFEELKKILESLGYEMNSPRGGSSHFTFRKKTYPHHNSKTRTDKDCICSISERSY